MTRERVDFGALSLLMISLATLVSCRCPDFDRLTLGIGYQSEGRTHSVPPPWNGRFVHPVDKPFQATVIKDVAFPGPAADAFELYRTTTGTPVKLALERSYCSTTRTSPNREGICSDEDARGGCLFEGMTWRPAQELQGGEMYRLVFYPDRGNGGRSDVDGERVTFEGSQVLVVDIVVESR